MGRHQLMPIKRNLEGQNGKSAVQTLREDQLQAAVK
jgi:hypothetical protein